MNDQFWPIFDHLQPFSAIFDRFNPLFQTNNDQFWPIFDVLPPIFKMNDHFWPFFTNFFICSPNSEPVLTNFDHIQPFFYPFLIGLTTFLQNITTISNQFWPIFDVVPPTFKTNDHFWPFPTDFWSVWPDSEPVLTIYDHYHQFVGSI